MLRTPILILSALVIGTTCAVAQDEPPPEGPPPGPHLIVPLPPETELPPPPPEGTPEEFVEAAIAAVDLDGNGRLSEAEIHAAHEAMHEGMPPAGPPPEGPPPEGPPGPHIFIPLPPDVELPPPPPEGDPDAFLAAAIAAIDGDGDGLLSAEEIKAAHEPKPMDMPPEGPPPFPHLFVPLPPDAALPPPPPEGTPEEFVAAAIAALDADGDGELSAEEIHAAHDVMPMDMPPEGMPPEGEPGGPSEGDEDLADLPHPPECGEELRESELLPQGENVSCDRSESVGNLIFRTVCNMDPYRDQAISLPEGRAADCFGLEAIKGHNIVFQIVKEADGAMMFDTSWGKEAFKTLVLVGEPGDTVYQLKLISADEPDAAITVKFIDHPTF